MIILEYMLIGAISAIGWWGSTHYIIEPYFPEPIPKVTKTEENKTDK